MNARVALPLAVLMLSVPFAAPGAHAGAWTLSPGEYYSQIMGSWSSSDTYHGPSGSRFFLARGGLVEERSLLSYNEIGWKKNLSFLVGIPVRSITRRFGVDGGQRALPTTSGLADGQIGFKYRLVQGGPAAAIQLEWKPPFSYDPVFRLSHQDSVRAGDATGDGDSLNVHAAQQLGRPVLGDGQNDVTVSLHLGTGLATRGFVQVAGGYRYRFQDPRDQIVGSADMGMWVGRFLMVGGRYDGLYTLEAADLPSVSQWWGAGSDPNQRQVRHRAGPMLLLRVDDRMDLMAYTMHTLTAKNALHTDEIFVGVAFRHTTLNRLQGFLGTAKNP